MYDIEFKGETCEVHGTYIRQRPNITVPVEEVELYRVAGRDGVLTGKMTVICSRPSLSIHGKSGSPRQCVMRMS